MIDKRQSRIRRCTRNRKKMKRSKSARLLIHRTTKHIYAQIISSNGYEVLESASTLEKSIRRKMKSTGNKQSAVLVGTTIAQRSLNKGIRVVSFDRSGFRYHGRIRALADAARAAGLSF